MWKDFVVLRMRNDTFHLDLLTVMCMRMASRHSQLDCPIIQVPQRMTGWKNASRNIYVFNQLTSKKFVTFNSLSDAMRSG